MARPFALSDTGSSACIDRAAVVDGELSVESPLSAGTVITARMPIRDE
jgi:hypothetical protein